MTDTLVTACRERRKFRVRAVARALAGATNEEAWASLGCNERREWLRQSTRAIEAYESTR